MKIYFDGCSWTQGAELENPEEERFSRLICNELGAEETNLGVGGGSNDRIIRNLLVENNIEEYDLAVIQMTLPARTEYLKEMGMKTRWIKVNPKTNYTEWLYTDSSQENMPELGDNKFDYYTQEDGHTSFWRHYYKNITNLKYFSIKENIQLQTIRNHCEVKGVPLILCSINKWSRLNFDYIMKVNLETRAKKGHPNRLGHQKIAKNLKKYDILQYFY